MDEIKNDKRFSHILTNPKYFKMGRKAQKLKVDSRFKDMFKSKDFKIKYTVDSRGRPWISSTNEDLKKYYDLSSSDENDEINDDKIKLENKKKEKIKVNTHLEKQLNKINTILEKKKKTNLDGNKLTNLNNKEKILVGSKKIDKKGKLNDISISKDKRKSNLIDHTSSHSEGESTGCDDKIVDKVKLISVDSLKKSYSEYNDFHEDEDDAVNSDATPFSDDDNHNDDNDGASDNDDNIEESQDPNCETDEGSSSDNDEILSNEISHAWGELDHDALRTEAITSRLALCNMDWDRIKAEDILVMLNSFKPENGVVNCVKIFLSDYGKERLEYEKFKGPPELTQAKVDDKNDSDDDNDDNSVINDDDDLWKQHSEGSKYHLEKLRQYQLSRLKYYYAIIECDSAPTADHIYNQCNSLEYESSANLIDLRFVPEGMKFVDDPVSISSTLPCHKTYKPTLYTSSALHQSNVELTWDETPADRVAVTMQDFSKVDFENMDVKDYLASASEDEDEDGGDEIMSGGSDNEGEKVVEGPAAELTMEQQIRKYKSLLESVEEVSDDSDNNVDMEITWEPGLKETVEKKLEEKKSSELTPWEKYLDKKLKKKKLKRNKNVDYLLDEDNVKIEKTKNEKKSKKSNVPTNEQQAELELLVMDGKNKIKVEKRKKNKKDKKQISPTTEKKKKDVDARFKEMFSDPRYNIDPTANEYHKIQKIKH